MMVERFEARPLSPLLGLRVAGVFLLAWAGLVAGTAAKAQTSSAVWVQRAPPGIHGFALIDNLSSVAYGNGITRRLSRIGGSFGLPGLGSGTSSLAFGSIGTVNGFVATNHLQLELTTPPSGFYVPEALPTPRFTFWARNNAGDSGIFSYGYLTGFPYVGGGAPSTAVITTLDPALAGLTNPAIGFVSVNQDTGYGLLLTSTGVSGNQLYVVVLGPGLLAVPPPPGRSLSTGGGTYGSGPVVGGAGQVAFIGGDLQAGLYLARWTVGDPASAIANDDLIRVNTRFGMNREGDIAFTGGDGAVLDSLYLLEAGSTTPILLAQEGDTFGGPGETLVSLVESQATPVYINNVGTVLLRAKVADAGVAAHDALLRYRNGALEKLAAVGEEISLIRGYGAPVQQMLYQITANYGINDLDQVVLATSGGPSSEIVMLDESGACRSLATPAPIVAPPGVAIGIPVSRPAGTRAINTYVRTSPIANPTLPPDAAGCDPCPCCPSGVGISHHQCIDVPDCTCSAELPILMPGPGKNGPLVTGVDVILKNGLPPAATLTLPEYIGDGLYEVVALDALGDPVGPTLEAIGGFAFDLTSLDVDGVSSFKVTGIEPDAQVVLDDPGDFIFGLTFIEEDGSAFDGELAIQVILAPEVPVGVWAAPVFGVLVIAFGADKLRRRIGRG